ncbi:MAG: hypothetical protein HUJ72_08025 [Blautia sp.]|nr:hypothetical protein [Blautia sp.]
MADSIVEEILNSLASEAGKDFKKTAEETISSVLGGSKETAKKKKTTTKKETAKKETAKKETAKKTDSSKTSSAKKTGTSKTSTAKTGAAKTSASKTSSTKKTTTSGTAKKTTTSKTASKTSSGSSKVKEEFVLQYKGKEVDTEEVMRQVKEYWTKELKNKASAMKKVRIYLKPEEKKAYFIINGETMGEIKLW